MNNYETQYKNLLSQVALDGNVKVGRNGATRSVFGATLCADLAEGFPLLTGRKMYPHGIFGELAAFVRGCEALADYQYFGCNYWNENAEKWGANEGKHNDDMLIGQYVGPLWRSFRAAEEAQFGLPASRDQLRTLIEQLRVNPMSRRHVLSAWHPGAEACIPPCTVMAIFNVQDGLLNCHVTMRSADLCLGVPSDMAQYALLTMLLAKDTGLTAGKVMFTFVDAHIYEVHLPMLDKYLATWPTSLPQLRLAETASTLLFAPPDVTLVDYEPNPPIAFPFVV